MHDFVTVDGTSVKDGSNNAPLMAMLASHLASSALLYSCGGHSGGHKGLLKQVQVRRDLLVVVRSYWCVAISVEKGLLYRYYC